MKLMEEYVKSQVKEKLTMNYEPKHAKEVGEGIPFQRIRRITGYLVGDFSRFNDAKKSEVNDRAKHTLKEVRK